MLSSKPLNTGVMITILLLGHLVLSTVSQQPPKNSSAANLFHRSTSIETCPSNLAILAEHRGNPACKSVKTGYCYRSNCKRCCHFPNSCNPHPRILVFRDKCKNVLCASIRCIYPGEYCDLAKDNTPRCHCPKPCPDQPRSSRVCGSDGVTYSSECALNRTSCLLGQHIKVTLRSPCDLRSRNLFVSPLHQKTVVLDVDFPGKIACSFLGNPISITWYKLDIDSLPPRMIPMMESLIIPKVSIADKGVYRCEAYDGFSVAEAFVNVTVEHNTEKPELDLSKRSKASCMLPRRYGYCNQHEVRWYFDVKTRTCHPFVFSGCGRNENNFLTEKQCQAACGHWAGDVCKLPKATGPCKAQIPKWFFHENSGECKRFIYGGCRGNANRFSSKVLCEVKCKAQSVAISPCIKLYMDAVNSHRQSIFTPRCTGDGRFQKKQCHGSVCFCMEENGSEMPGTRAPVGQKIDCLNKGPHLCGTQKKKNKANRFSGKHVPQCKQDGTFENVQCSPLTGHCWCVNTYGKEMPGTRTRAPLLCPTMEAVLTNCQRRYIDSYKNPRPGSFIPHCAEDGSFSAVQCQGSNSTCSCVDRETGEEQSGSDILFKVGKPQCKTKGGLTICQRMHKEAIKHPEMSQYVPQCKENGQFENVQCDPGTLACWCIDKYGMEITGTKVQGSVLCPDLGSELTTCQRRYQRAMKRMSNKLNQHAPECKPDGSFEEIQCHGQTCHCVDNNGLEILKTRVQSVARKPNCSHPESNLSSCEKARRIAMTTGKFVPRCQPDGKWQTIQCEHTTKECWCLDENFAEMKDTRTTGLLACNQDIKGKCWVDYVKAIRSSRRSSRLPWCRTDGSYNPMQCYGSFCYCVTKDGDEIPGSKLSVMVGKPNCTSAGESLTRCQRQYQGAMLSGFMGGHVPRCKRDGRYEEVQCQAGTSLCWCVDGEGNELPGTRTANSVKCPVIEGPLSPCQSMYLDYARHPSIHRMTPRCKPGGEFEPVQCKVLFCFCVDEDGREIPGTRLSNVIGRPVCNIKEKYFLTPCQREAKIKSNIKNRHKPRCKKNGNYEEVQCDQGSGQCWCVDKQGRELAGTRTTGYLKCPSAGHSLTPCQKEYQSILRRSLLPRAVPQCTSEGRYESVQCTDDYCFCVNAYGVEIAYSRVSASKERPVCQPVGIGPTLCQKQLQVYMRSDDHRQLEPSCNPDGSFRDIQCYGAECYCVDSRGVEILGTRKKFIDGKPICKKKYFSLTPCQQQLQELMSFPSNSSHFVPRCNKDGEYEPIQCNHVTGYCWCVDGNGKEIENTKTRGKIECGLQVTLASRCWNDYVLTSNTSHPGSFTPWCSKSGTYDPTQIQGSRYFCVNDRGLEVLGTTVSIMQEKPNCKAAVSPGFIPSPCQREQIRHTYAPKSEGRYVPTCNTDGSYDSIQCDTTQGQCWCVDRDGQELDGMRTAGMIICPTDAPLTRCQVQKEKSLRSIFVGFSLPLFVPRCKLDGGFEEVQCHGLTGQCWCVDENGNEVPGSATIGRRPDCAKAEKMTSCQRNRVVAMGLTGRPYPGRYVPQCTYDGKYKPVQCHGGTGLCWCVNEQGQELIGTRTWGDPHCQRTLSENGFPLDIAIMLPPSSSDITSTSMKSFTKSIVTSFDISSSGTRFSFIIFADDVYSPLMFSSLEGVKVSKASVDKVLDEMKLDGSVTRLDKGLQWVDQEIFNEFNGMRSGVQKVLIVIVDKKQTRDQGRYIPLSIASEGFKTKGIQVYCIGIDSKVELGELMDVCSSPGDVFTVHNYEDLAKSGQEIVEIIKNHTRNELRAVKQCNLPVKAGRRGCLASIPSWYYNSVTGQCLQFTYSGCGGNGNNFATHEKCRKSCGGILPLCYEINRRRASLSISHHQPTCKRTGEYKAVQCYEASSYCWCVDQQGTEIPHTRVKGGVPMCKIHKGTSTPCIDARRKALGEFGVPSIGRHVPDCDANGNYNRIQSEVNFDYYWCVDSYGYVIPGTQQWGIPNCTDTVKCPVFQDHATCASSPQCSQDNECRTSLKCCACGNTRRCLAIDKKRKATLSECELERTLSTSGLITYGKGLFKPQCKSDGKYNETQCYGDVCWCVDNHGNERAGTRQRGLPNCKRVAILTPCQKEHNRALVLRSVTPLSYFVTQCDSNGEYESAQCHSATGYCWCVDKKGSELVGTRKWGKTNCTNTNAKEQTVCQFRHDECQDNIPPSHFIPQCKDDGSYQSLQCMESMGECWCVDQYGYELPRTRTSSSNKPNCKLLAWLTPCQIQRRQAIGTDGTPVVGLFVPECKASGAYEPVQCHTDPVTHDKSCWCVNSHGVEIEGSRRKPGIRPVCGKNSLCKEIREEASNSTKKSFLYQCQKDGKFSPVQCAVSPGMCWCVNEYGNEIHNTMSMKVRNCTGVGLTQCQYRHNQAISIGSSTVPQCDADGSYSPMQCDDQQCWCVDRHNREVLRTRRIGKADCRSKEDTETCKLPFVRGPCEALLHRWYFNSTTNKCSVFLYGGCAGNDNKFVNYRQCQEQCRGTPLTSCQQRRLAFRFDPISHQPDCYGDGRYKPIQCHHVTKECWCVNVDGSEIRGYKTSNGTKPICPDNNEKALKIQGLM